MSRLEAALRRAQTLNQDPERRASRPTPVPLPAPVPGPVRAPVAASAPLPAPAGMTAPVSVPMAVTAQVPVPMAVATAPPAPSHDREAELRTARAIAALTREIPEVALRPEPELPSALNLTGIGADKLVITNKPEQSTVEQYRKLAGTLHHAQVERDLKVVMVSSAVSGDGKTLTSTNLALTLSESYRRRVLLIDADLRRPSVHEVFQLKNTTGLTDALTAPTDRQLPIVVLSPYLSVLLAGRPDSDPMSGLTSDRMQRLITEAAEAFDWVIIDTPPVVLLPDANLLATMVDGAILVIGAGKTPYKLITRAIDAIGRKKLLGVVLNRVDPACLAGGYGYGYYSYGER